MNKFFEFHKCNILLVVTIFVMFMAAFVALAQAQEVYKQQVGQTQVTLVIHPAKEGVRQKKKSLSVVSTEDNIWEQITKWLRGI